MMMQSEPVPSPVADSNTKPTDLEDADILEFATRA